MTYWQYKLKQFQLNIYHCRRYKALKVLTKVHFTIECQCYVQIQVTFKRAIHILTSLCLQCNVVGKFIRK